MSVSQFFTVAIISSLTMAQDADLPVAEETTEAMSKFDNACFHCIDDGNLFCATDATAATGTCVAALCNEQEDLAGDEKRAAIGKCTLKNHACTAGIPMINYSSCMPSYVRDVAKCPSKIQITKAEIEKGGSPYIESSTGNEAFEPFEKSISVDKMGVCVTTISSPDLQGGWSLTEWEPEIYVMMTRLEDGAVWDTSNSGMYAAETYFYNRETRKDGDITGRVPVKTNVDWQLLFLNYDKDEEQSVKIEYGAAMSGLVATTLGLAATALTLLM